MWFCCTAQRCAETDAGFKEETYETVSYTHLDVYKRQIHAILKNCSSLYVRMAGVYIDGQLEAFTIGSLNVRANMAVIDVYKRQPRKGNLLPKRHGRHGTCYSEAV